MLDGLEWPSAFPPKKEPSYLLNRWLGEPHPWFTVLGKIASLASEGI